VKEINQQKRDKEFAAAQKKEQEEIAIQQKEEAVHQQVTRQQAGISKISKLW